MSKPQFSRKRKGKKVEAYPLGTKEKGKSSQTKGSRGRPRKPKVKIQYLITWSDHEGLIVWEKGSSYKASDGTKGQTYINIGNPRHTVSVGGGGPPASEYLTVTTSTEWSKRKVNQLGKRLEKFILEERVQDIQARLELTEDYLATGKVKGVIETEGQVKTWETSRKSWRREPEAEKKVERPTRGLGGPSITLPALKAPKSLTRASRPPQAEWDAVKFNPRYGFWDPNPNRKGNPDEGRYMKIKFGFSSRIPKKKMVEYAEGPYRKRLRRAARKNGYTIDSVTVTRDGKRSRVEVEASKIVM